MVDRDEQQDVPEVVFINKNMHVIFKNCWAVVHFLLPKSSLTGKVATRQTLVSDKTDLCKAWVS